MVALSISALGPTLLTMDVWIDDRHRPSFPPAGPWRPRLPVQPALSSAQLCWLSALWMLSL